MRFMPVERVHLPGQRDAHDHSSMQGLSVCLDKASFTGGTIAAQGVQAHKRSALVPIRCW
jgi:hypothetical protein